MVHARSRWLIASLIAIVSTCSSAHDRPNPTDPSIKFERIIGDGLAEIEANADRALFFRDTLIEARSLFNKAAVWTDKESLAVCFWNGDVSTQRAVITSAARWQGVSRLRLLFSDSKGNPRKCSSAADGDVRISLYGSDAKVRYENDQDPWANWSLIGRQSTFQPPGSTPGSRYAVTMNLPYVAANLKVGDIDTMNFTVGHEFGHALGLLHEFQSQSCKGWIDVAQLAKDMNWVGDVASYNLDALPDIADKYRISLGLIGTYDPLSTMQYNLALKYFVQKPGQSNPCQRSTNVTAPSAGDKATVAAIYGLPGKGATGVAQGLAQRVAHVKVELAKAFAFASKDSADMAAALQVPLKNYRRLEEFEHGR